MSHPDLFSDYLDVEPFAAAVSRTPRTVYRWMGEPAGLPSVKIGSRVLIHIPTAKAWILGRMRKPNARPPRRVRATAERDARVRQRVV
jgi:hypothetical protein